MMIKEKDMDIKYLRIRKNGDVIQFSIYSDKNRRLLINKFKIKASEVRQ